MIWILAYGWLELLYHVSLIDVMAITCATLTGYFQEGNEGLKSSRRFQAQPCS
jgi:hypothetical protein